MNICHFHFISNGCDGTCGLLENTVFKVLRSFYASKFALVFSIILWTAAVQGTHYRLMQTLGFSLLDTLNLELENHITAAYKKRIPSICSHTLALPPEHKTFIQGNMLLMHKNIFTDEVSNKRVWMIEWYLWALCFLYKCSSVFC